MIKKYPTKIKASVSPHALIRTINFIVVIVFPGLILRQGLSSWDINAICHHFQFVVEFVSLPCFTLPVELIL